MTIIDRGCNLVETTNDGDPEGLVIVDLHFVQVIGSSPINLTEGLPTTTTGTANNRLRDNIGGPSPKSIGSSHSTG